MVSVYGKELFRSNFFEFSKLDLTIAYKLHKYLFRFSLVRYCVVIVRGCHAP